MLIVEGPDGAGKSTLVKRLSDHLDMYVMPRVVTEEGSRTTDLVQWVHDDVTSGLKRAIYDRHRLISEPIYGPILRNTVEPGFDNFRWLREYQQQLHRLEPFVIFCLPPLPNMLKNIGDDESSQWMWHAAEQIYWLYFNLAASWPGTATAVWDYTQNEDSYRGSTRYDALHSHVTDWLWKKGLYHGSR